MQKCLNILADKYCTDNFKYFNNQFELVTICKYIYQFYCLLYFILLSNIVNQLHCNRVLNNIRETILQNFFLLDYIVYSSLLICNLANFGMNEGPMTTGERILASETPSFDLPDPRRAVSK